MTALLIIGLVAGLTVAASGWLCAFPGSSFNTNERVIVSGLLVALACLAVLGVRGLR
jgi:hypothetical protein